MSDISWADGMRIIEAARQAISAGPSSAAQPATPPATDHSFKSVLTDEQAQAFNLMMDIMGHNGDTVGRGSVVPLLPRKDQ